MGILVNPDNLAFQVALNSEIYVDKSGLIKYTNKVLNTLQAYICNSRPRRFGKSITANMLTAYYSRGCNSEEMFAGLEISKSADFKKHLNQYDVIHLDIQWCIEPAGGPERVVSYISEKTIAELAEYYPGVLTVQLEKNLLSSLMNGMSLFVTRTLIKGYRKSILIFSGQCSKEQNQQNIFNLHILLVFFQLKRKKLSRH